MNEAIQSMFVLGWLVLGDMATEDAKSRLWLSADLNPVLLWCMGGIKKDFLNRPYH